MKCFDTGINLDGFELNSNIGCFEIICSPRYITPFLPLNSNIGCFEICLCQSLQHSLHWLNSNIGCFEILIEREVTHYDAVKQ